MKSINLWAYLLAFVVVCFLFASCVPTAEKAEPSFLPEPAVIEDNAGYPAPTIEAVETSTVSVARPSAYPAPSPQSKPTPWPSPARNEQPTPTSLPLPQPSNDVGGNLYFTIIDNTEPVKLFAAPVFDGKVMDQSWRQILPEELLSAGNNPPRLYPSPTGNLLAIVQSQKPGPGDIVNIIDLNENFVTPIHNNQNNEMPYLWQFEGWHPDGRRFLVSDADHFKGLWIFDGLGIKKPEKLVEHNPDSASMSPTGQTLAYAYRPKLGKESLLVLAWYDGSRPEAVLETPAKTPVTELSWAPDGKSLAYVKGTAEIWIYREGKHIQLVDDYRAYSGYSWSPDSRFIAYTSYAKEDEKLPTPSPSVVEIFKQNFNGTELHIVDVSSQTVYVPEYGEVTGAFLPEWSPDGRFVIFLSIKNEQSIVAKVDTQNLESIKVEEMLDSGSMISASVWIIPVQK